MPKFLERITAQEFSAASSAAIDASVDGDSNARIQIDAGGKITWGPGNASGDATLYRSAANILKTDDTLEAALGVITLATDGAPSTALANGALAVDTTNDTFYFRSSGSWQEVSGGGASLTVSDTAPSSPEAGNLWFESDTGRTLVYYADGSSNQWVEVGVASSAGISGSDGYVQFTAGGSHGSNANLFWDNSNSRLGIGTVSPGYPLDVSGTSRFTGAITASGGVTGALTGNADTATEATNVTAVANNSTDETVYPTFVDGATGTQGIETDTGLTYNPSSGLLTAAAFSGPLTGNVTGNASGTALTVTQAAQSAITSVGTLTGLTVGGAVTVGVNDAGHDVKLFGDTDTAYMLWDASADELIVDGAGTGGGSGGMTVQTTVTDGGAHVQIANDAQAWKWLVNGSISDSMVLRDQTSGVNRFAFTTGGSLVIGSTTAIATLDVRGQITAHGDAAVYEGVNVGAINIHGGVADTVLDWGEGLVFTSGAGGSGNWTHAGIVGVGQSGFRGDLVFGTDGDGTQNTSGITEKMRVTHGGNVGIGTTNPSSTLHVAGNIRTSSALIVEGTNATAIRLTQTDTDGAYISFTETDGSTRMGYMGFPSNDDLHMKNETAGGHVYLSTNNTTRLTVNNAGRVGIGRYPSYALDVETPNAASYVRFKITESYSSYSPSTLIMQGGANTAASIWFGDSADPDIGAIHYYNSNNTMRFYVNAAERMRIDSDGFMAIGTSTSRTMFRVKRGTGVEGSPPSGAWASEIYHASNSSGSNGLLVLNEWMATASTILECGSINASTGAYTQRFKVDGIGNVAISGSLSKGSGSFDIAHPTKGGDWRLRHAFIEGPQADLIYRGTATLSGGTATVDLDTAANMTDGTWVALCRDPWVMVASSGNAVEWSLSGKTLTITSDTADAVCSWLVMAERQDDHMKNDSPLADDDGRLIPEYELPPVEVADPPAALDEEAQAAEDRIRDEREAAAQQMRDEADEAAE